MVGVVVAAAVGGGLGPAAAEEVLELDGGGEPRLRVVAREEARPRREPEPRRALGRLDALLGGAARGGVRGERLREPPRQGVERLRRHLHSRRRGDLAEGG